MMKVNAWVVACAAVAVARVMSAMAAPAELPNQPELTGPLPQTPASYAFGAAAHQNVPLDLSARGYVEEEYIVRGRARVFDWGVSRNPVVLAEGPYITRILVRRPKDAARFSGTVIVEPFNQSANVDLPIMWAQSHEQFMADGYAWVGLSTKPNTLRALKLFDSARYAAVGFPNPRPAPACAVADINPLSQPSTVNDETGLTWDAISQLGALLKSDAGSRLIGAPVARLYMTGQSQSAGYARTYASVFAHTVATKEGKPLYDGYLYSGSPPWQVPLHQCRKDLADGDPRLITPAVGVPVIEIFAQGDIGTNIGTRRPDSDAAPDLFRRYEVAGASHVDPFETQSFPSDADMKRAQGRMSSGAEPDCRPQNVTLSDFPVRYAFDAAWRNLDAWVRKGITPPRAERLQLKPDSKQFVPETAFVLDAFGNAQGGVRSTYVDVPTVRWVGSRSGSFRCMFYGYRINMPGAELRRLYPDHASYVQKVRARADQLVAERWLTPADRDSVVREAERAQIP
jgi:hypothetical protein